MMDPKPGGHDRWAHYCQLCKGLCAANPEWDLPEVYGRRRRIDAASLFLQSAIKFTRWALEYRGGTSPIDVWRTHHYKREARRTLEDYRELSKGSA